MEVCAYASESDTTIRSAFGGSSVILHFRLARVRGAYSKLKKAFLLIGILIFFSVCAGLVFYLELRMFAEAPANAANTGKVLINVRPGQSLKTTAGVLYDEEIIKSALKLALIARFEGIDKRLKAGEYLLSAAMTPRQILQIMVKGEVKLYKLTIPEGYSSNQIAELVEQAGFGTKEAFNQMAKDATLARALGLTADRLEGYLFPDTYFFPKGTTVKKIITVMVRRFGSVFKPEWKARAESLGFSVHQVVTLASIIEKETGASFERPIISSVFHNRLRKRMRLESDPTVIYGIQDFDGNLTRKHLKTRTPYNTYKIKGLPIGPIANPGRASLEAALFPEKTSYIYFVSKKDTTHQFSTNLKQHNRAVRKYQLNRKK